MRTVLTGERVDAVLKDCLSDNPEFTVKGLVSSAQFDRDKIEKNKPHIAEMLRQLPKEFLRNSGGGWSFLNLCRDADGNQWTGLHRTMEALCLLAIAAGMGEWMMRDMADILPGGMPYVVFDPPAIVEAA